MVNESDNTSKFEKLGMRGFFTSGGEVCCAVSC
jgi:hypothetical protein